MKLENLVLSGGAMKGIAYIGVLKYLEENKLMDNIKSLTGTSIGALFCLLINLKYTSSQIKNIVNLLDVFLLEDIQFQHLLSNYSIDTRNKIDAGIDLLLYMKDCDNITFLELYNKTNIKLTFISTNLNNSTSVELNYITTPHLSVSKATQMSINIPLLWKSISYKNNYYVDGCFTNNFPLNLLESEKDTTIGICLKSINNEIIASLPTYILKVIDATLINKNTKDLNNYITKGFNVVVIDTNSILKGSLDFNVSKKNRIIDSLIDLGYASILSFVKKRI